MYVNIYKNILKNTYEIYVKNGRACSRCPCKVIDTKLN